MKKIVSIVIVFLILLSTFPMLTRCSGQAESSEPPATEWSRKYGTPLQDSAYSVVQTDDGGYAIAGYTGPFNGPCDFWLVKTNSTGHMQWNHTYHNDHVDRAEALIETDDGGYALAGVTGPGSLYRDIWLVKTNSTGHEQWNHKYGYSGRGNEYAYSIIQTDDGGYALAGTTEIPAQGYRGDCWLIKIHENGNMEWNQTYGGTGGASDIAYSVAQTDDGGYALAGLTESFDARSGDFWLIKTNQTGHEQWNQTYGGPYLEDAHSMVLTDDGGYALAGDTWSFGAGAPDLPNFWLVKTNPTGDMEWNQTYGGKALDQAYSMVKTSDGGYAVAGFTTSFGAGGYDSWLIKTNSTGHMQWNQTNGGENNDRTMSIVRADDGGYALAGYTESFGAVNGDFWLIKLEGVPFQSPATWLYNFDQYDLDVLVGNLDSMGFKTVWLSTNTTKLDEESYTGKVSSFIGKAREEDIFVHAMILQDPNFTRTVNHITALQDVNAVLSYNLENPGRTFDGIHIDVEPYGLNDWSKTNWENNNNLMAMYIELLSKIHLSLQGKSLMFSAAHPHWYQNMANEFPDEFPNGQTSQFGEYLDAIVLMVYDGEWARALDTTLEILDEAEEEIEKADLAGNVDIIVGLGVQEFWKYSWLNDGMIQVDQELETNPSYKGLSVFNYKSFSEIKTWEYRIEDRRRHTVLMVNTTDRHFKLDNASTPEEEFSAKEATLMLRTRSNNIIILHQDEEIKLIALITDSWLIGRCFATAEDSQTGKKYVLNDTYWLLGR